MKTNRENARCMYCGMVNYLPRGKDWRLTHKHNCLIVGDMRQAGKFLEFDLEAGTCTFTIKN
jgi:hypothetical protein